MSRQESAKPSSASQLPWTPNAQAIYGADLLDDAGRAVLERAAAIAWNHLAERGIKRVGGMRDLDMLFRAAMGPLQREVAVVLGLSDDWRALDFNVAALGAVDVVAATAQELVRSALLRRASFAIFAHNHPGGPPEPSQGDIEACRIHRRCFGAAGVGLVDWLVVTNESTTSLRERRLPPDAWSAPSPEVARKSAAEVTQAFDTAPSPPPEPEKELAYAEAEQVLARLSPREEAIHPQWIRGAFHRWGQSAPDWHAAAMALDSAWRPIAYEVLEPAGGSSRNLFTQVCSFALRTYSKRCFVAVRSEMPFERDLCVNAFAANVMLGSWGLDLLDVVATGRHGTLSLREAGYFTRVPE